jgi:tetratricopeptide (TPR) repeat protein
MFRHCLVMLALCAGLAAWAQTTPDGLLYLQGNQLLNNKNAAGAAACYRVVVDRYPDSPVRDQALGKLYACYGWLNQPADAARALAQLREGYPTSLALAQIDVELVGKAAGRWQDSDPAWWELTARWPKSAYVWKAAVMVANAKTKSDPAGTLTFLDGLLKKDLLSDQGVIEATVLRFTLLSTLQPDQFMEEALPVVEAGARAKDVAAITVPARVAILLYLPLMSMGEFDRAHLLSIGLQERLDTLRNPNNWVQADMVAYYTALSKTNPSRFIKEALPLAPQTVQVKTRPEVSAYASILKLLYLPLLKARRDAEVDAVYRQVDAMVRRVGYKTFIEYNNAAYTQALFNTEPDRYMTVMRATIDDMPKATCWEDLKGPGTDIIYVFGILANQGKRAEAKVLYDKIMVNLNRFPELAYFRMRTTEHYLRYARANDDEALTLGLPYLKNLDALTTNDELLMANELAIYGVYPSLMTIGKVVEAGKVHLLLQDTLQQQGLRDAMSKEQAAFSCALLTVNGARMLPDALAVIEGAKNVTAPADARLAVLLAPPVYQTLAGQGKGDALCTVHDQVQALITRVGNPENWAAQDTKAFADSSVYLANVYAAFCARACRGKDRATAAKWLKGLTDFAPDTPQTLRARTFFEATFGKP